MNERVVLYTRKGCHLCDNARDLVREVCAEQGVAWREVDIDSDSLVRARLSDLTPVVEVDGVQVGYWRIRPELVRLALETPPGVVGDNRPMPTVHLVRHGHVHNPDAVLYGRLPNFHLSDTGRQMADAVAEYLVETGLPVSRVIASPLPRAQETAAPIARAFGLPIDSEPRIIEAGNVYEGERLPSGVKDFLHPRNWWRLRNPWKPSWGEPFTEQADRMWGAMGDAARATPDGDTVMVSHQLPIWVARLSFERRNFLHDPRKRECGLASITSFRFEGGEPVEMTYATPAAHIKAPK